MASTDFLTGINNKSAFLSKVTERLKTVNGQTIAMLMIDIDNFKSINDGYGHLIGDKILSEAAKILGEVWKSEVIIGRFGGDEFVIYSESLDMSSLKKKVAETKEALTKIESNLYKITCSIGAYITNIPEGVNELIEKADKAMYKVKRSGRNGCYISDRFADEIQDEIQ